MSQLEVLGEGVLFVGVVLCVMEVFAVFMRVVNVLQAMAAPATASCSTSTFKVHTPEELIDCAFLHCVLKLHSLVTDCRFFARLHIP
jgi:hypothetical protein